MNNRVIFHAAAVLMVGVWAISFLNTKELLPDLGPMSAAEVCVYRFIIAYIALLACCKFKIKMFAPRDELVMLICGLTGGSIYFAVENRALPLTTVSDIAILVALSPLITTLILVFILKKEKFSVPMFLGSLVAFVGVVMLTLRDGMQFTGDGMARLIGDLLAFIAAVCWSIYSLILKQVDHKYSTLDITRKMFFYSFITALPMIYLFNETPGLTWEWFKNPRIWGNLMFLGLICSMGAFFLWGWCVKKIGAIRASNYLYLGPIISMFASIIYEYHCDFTHINAWGYLGCILVMLGVIVVDKQEQMKHLLHHKQE